MSGHEMDLRYLEQDPMTPVGLAKGGADPIRVDTAPSPSWA